MEEDKKEYMIEVMKGLPTLVGIAFGSPLVAMTGGISVLGQGLEYLRKKNIDWTNDYLNEAQVLFTIDDARKSAENIQFVQEVIKKVVFETREEKRKRFLYLAINYHKKQGLFDEKMGFLNLLDRISEEDLLYFLNTYNDQRQIFAEETLKQDEIRKMGMLTGYGIMQIRTERINEAIYDIRDALNSYRKDDDFIVPSEESYANLEYTKTEFGGKFFNFLQEEASTK